MTTVLAIDPGTTESAFVVLDHAGNPARHGKGANPALLAHIADWCEACPGSTLVVEMIASYGMPVGAEVFQTCVWIGRYVQAWRGAYSLVYRRDVKLHLCGSSRAKDGNVRQALLDRFGGKEKAVGKKASPGPLYGIKADIWQALAIACAWRDQHERGAA